MSCGLGSEPLSIQTFCLWKQIAQITTRMKISPCPVLDQKRALAKQQGLWAPQAPKDRGGLGLPVTGWAAFYEEANRSIFGPVVLNCAAPDGNINLLSKIGTEAQKDWFLQPLIDGKSQISLCDD